MVGAPYAQSYTGAAYVFAKVGATWVQQAELTASDAANGDEFGWSVSISGSTVAIGAPGHYFGIGVGLRLHRHGRNMDPGSRADRHRRHGERFRQVRVFGGDVGLGRHGGGRRIRRQPRVRSTSGRQRRAPGPSSRS